MCNGSHGPLHIRPNALKMYNLSIISNIYAIKSNNDSLCDRPFMLRYVSSRFSQNTKKSDQYRDARSPSFQQEILFNAMHLSAFMTVSLLHRLKGGFAAGCRGGLVGYLPSRHLWVEWQGLLCKNNVVNLHVDCLRKPLRNYICQLQLVFMQPTSILNVLYIQEIQ